MCLHTHIHSLTWEGERSTWLWPGHLEHSECFGDGNVIKLSSETQSWDFCLSNEVTERTYKHRTIGGHLANFYKGSFWRKQQKENKSKRWRKNSNSDDILWKPEERQIFTEACSTPILSNYMSQYTSAWFKSVWFRFLSLATERVLTNMCSLPNNQSDQPFMSACCILAHVKGDLHTICFRIIWNA